ALRAAVEPAAGPAPAVARADGGGDGDQRGAWRCRGAEDGVQQAARIPRRAAGHTLGRGQLALPPGDLLAGERVQRPLAPVRPDEQADPVLGVPHGAGPAIVQALPAADPFADRDLARPRVGPRAGADLRLLVAAPAERG